MKNKIRTVIVAIFSFILFTVVFYALIKRYATPLIAYIASSTLALIFMSIYLGASEKNRKNAKAKENMKNFFIFTPTSPQEYFSLALSSRYKTSSINNVLVAGDACVYFYFSLSPLSQSNVIDCFKNRTKDKIIIMCFSYDKKAYRLCESLPCDIKIFDEHMVFKFLSAFNSLPKEEILISKKYPFSALIKDFSSAKLTKRLFFSSFVIAMFSFITPFKNYYAIISFILLLLCILPYFLRLIFANTKNTPR